jgi:hypothetical protein
MPTAPAGDKAVRVRDGCSAVYVFLHLGKEKYAILKNLLEKLD